MACKISELGAVIAAEIGSTETPADSNKTKYGKWYGQDGQPWCDMFQAWCANQVGATDICGKFAYTPYHASFFKNKGAWYTTPKKGDYAFFHNGKRICHIGWVEKVIDSNTVQTIEGNTGSGSNADGGQVQRRKRSISGTPKWKIVGFGRPVYLDEVSAGEPVNTTHHVQEYKVKQGDSLWDISQKYHVSVDDIKKVNPGIDEKNLPVGKELKIPNTGGPANIPPQMQTYEVKKDDTLYKLHQRFNVSVDDIKKVNPDIDEKNLPVGKIINIPKPNTGGGGRPTPPSGLSPSGDNFNKVWKFFKDLGFSDEATAGIMGNLQQESQMDPTSKQGNGRKPGRGLAQWETNKIRGGSGRWETLEKFADRENLDKWDLYTQLKFIWWELTEEPWIKSQVKIYAGSLEKFMKIKNIDDAIIKWERMYEQAGDPVLDDRKKFAYAIYTRFARV
ncbi:phage tail tip lysozyme [Bacillus cereus]|uniref:phage tail tip lysozyme n=1 Tax=Bacillus cereus TaxID=1396 RepID=UPI0018F45A1D|nr:phage tail tip lysozyme [Bacillus cereus]MBJ7935861.1 LysM peptidoglycan-binding domain-containing protein [Bacillus cereus]